ncbi:MAG: hypothetical protein IJM25_06335 [Eubacterium sp.]|nr:hypothetical protein [Eubacterium sp.]
MYQGKILNRKFYQYLFPTVLCVMATSLNEFVDSIIVSRMLGAEAMSLVNLGAPVMLAFAMLYVLLGVGGSAVYAVYAGRMEKKKADGIFTLTMIVSAVLIAIIILFGLFFTEPLAGMMCKSEDMLPQFVSYLRIVTFSGILILPLQVIISFMPAFGHPAIGTALNIIANVVNLIFDYVFIRILGDVRGAGLGTLSGYIAGAIVVLVLWQLKKVSLPFARITFKVGEELKGVVKHGISPSINQLGFCIKIAFSNWLAFEVAQMTGVTTFALCIQVVSILSIFIGGILGAVIPLVAALYGQRDFHGMRILMKTGLKLQFIINMVLLLILELWPEVILWIYGVGGEDAQAAISAVRIFSIMFVFRGFTILFIYYLPIIKRSGYAMVISIIDGFAGVIPIEYVLSRFYGINGIWAGFTVTSVLLLIGVVITNYIISRRSEGAYSSFLLLENESREIPTFATTVEMKDADISRLTPSIQEFCKKEQVDNRIAVLTAISTEEMSLYSICHSSRIDYIDILLKIYPDHILMDFRSIGDPFDLTSADPEEYSNLAMLKKMVTTVDYNYVMGMNQTRITICREAKILNR